MNVHVSCTDKKENEMIYWELLSICCSTPQRWRAACRPVHVSPSMLTCTQRSTERWGTVCMDCVPLCLPHSWPPPGPGGASGSCVKMRRWRCCAARGRCSCAGVGGQDSKHGGYCGLWNRGGPPTDSCLALQTSPQQSRPSRGRPGVRKYTQAGWSWTPDSRPALHHPPAGCCVQRLLTASRDGSGAASGWWRRPVASVCWWGRAPWWGRWGGPGGRWRAGSPQRSRPGRERWCGARWPRSDPSATPLCPLWWWAAGGSSWTAVGIVAAWLMGKKNTTNADQIFGERLPYVHVRCFNPGLIRLEYPPPPTSSLSALHTQNVRPDVFSFLATTRALPTVCTPDSPQINPVAASFFFHSLQEQILCSWEWL